MHLQERRHPNGRDWIFFVYAIDTDSSRPAIVDVWNTAEIPAAVQAEALARYLRYCSAENINPVMRLRP